MKKGLWKLLRSRFLHDRSWYKLDNAGKIYPALITRRYTSLHRLSLNLKKPVSLPLIRKALRDVMPRFPYYQVCLKQGFFWYFLETNPRIPPVEGDSLSPCMDFPLKKRGMFLFRIRIYKNRIAVEFSHILTDGTGALIFLKTLTARYLSLKGIPVEADEKSGILDIKADPDPEEFDDAFQKNYNRRLPESGRGVSAYHIEDSLLPRGKYNIITGIMSVQELKEQASHYGISLGEYLTARLIEAFQEYMNAPERKGKKKKPIRMNVPVNLRGLYPSKSMRNFFLSVEPWIDPRLGYYEFSEICSKVHLYMRYEVDQKFLNQQITRNVKGELKLLNRLFPLTVKNMFLPAVYRFLGENNYTSSLSNLGRITLPPAMGEQIESFDFYPPPSTGNKIKCTALSYNGEMRVSFGSLIESTEIERLFFCALRKSGVRVRIESNRFY